MPILTWIDATEGRSELAPLWAFLAGPVRILAAGRFDTRLRHVLFASGGVRHAATRLPNDAALLAAAVSEEQDSDVIVLGCWGRRCRPFARPCRPQWPAYRKHPPALSDRSHGEPSS